MKAAHFLERFNRTGVSLTSAKVAAVFFHGRGSAASTTLKLCAKFEQPGLAIIAPQAKGDVWYPQPFFAERAANEPELSAADRLMDELLGALSELRFPPSRTILMGFSQGACLVLDYVARKPRRYGCLIGFSGSLIGSEPFGASDGPSLEGTPILISGAEADPHVPLVRVEKAAAVMQELRGDVRLHIRRDSRHLVASEEILLGQRLIGDVVATCR